MKNHSEETQTLRTGCSKAESHCRPPSRGTGRRKFN